MMADLNFPRLTVDNHRKTSPATPEYNCIAWSAGDPENWWQPRFFWPSEVAADEFGIDVLIEAFRSLGYVLCVDDQPEPDFEKVALYGSANVYTHAARQLPGGWWTSKLGKAEDEDIEHETPQVLAGGAYGEVVQFMKRRTADRDVQVSHE
jgi:hypothetical protein